jgi:hypothetical protein
MRFTQGNRRPGDRPRRRRGLGVGTASLGLSLEPRLLLAGDVLTYHNDNMRTGENLAESGLTPANVNAAQFGKVGQVAVDGQLFAQPLYKSGVTIPGQGTHNVVFVATEHDSVYAFDADTLALLWHRSFINPAAGVTTVPSAEVRMISLVPEIGITGTPVIDPSTGTLYVDAMTKEVSGRSVQYVHRLHALDLATGDEMLGGPVTIQASVRGAGAGRFRGQVSFLPKYQLQRAGLLLDGGTVFIAWASFGDHGPYHGWLIGYDARTLRQVSAFNVTPNGSEGGIWMSGGAPAADPNHNIFLSVGNGTFNANRRGRDFGGTVLKLAPGGQAVADYFAPANQNKLNSSDLDLGSGGVLLLPDQPGPHPHLLVTGSKEGRIYVLDRDNLGRYDRRTDHVVQELPQALYSAFDTPAYFNGTVYYVGTPPLNHKGGGDVLKAFRVVNDTLAPPTRGNFPYGYPGATPSISANGASNGIVWTLDNGPAGGGPAVLRAYDPNDVTHELYDSTQAGSRDLGGPPVKFAVPTVANGKVYVGGSGTLTVYGLLSNLAGPTGNP